MDLRKALLIVLILVLTAPFAYALVDWMVKHYRPATGNYKVDLTTRLHLVYDPLTGITIDAVALHISTKPAIWPFAIGGERLFVSSPPLALMSFGEKEHVIDITVTIYRRVDGGRSFVTSTYNEITWRTFALTKDTTVKSVTNSFALPPATYVIKLTSMNAEFVVDDTRTHEVMFEFTIFEDGSYTEPVLLVTPSVGEDPGSGPGEEEEEGYEQTGRVSFFAQILLGDRSYVVLDSKPTGEPVEGELHAIWYVIEDGEVKRVEKTFSIPKSGKQIDLGYNVQLICVPYLAFSAQVGTGKFTAVLDNMKAQDLNGRSIYAVVGKEGVKVSVMVMLFDPLESKSYPADKFYVKIIKGGSLVKEAVGVDGEADVLIPLSLIPSTFTIETEYAGTAFPTYRGITGKKQLYIDDPTISHMVYLVLGNSGVAVSAYLEGMIATGYVSAKVYIYDDGNLVAEGETRSAENPYVFIPLNPSEYRLYAEYYTHTYEETITVLENQVTWVNIYWREFPTLSIPSAIYIPGIGVVNVVLLIASILATALILILRERLTS